MNITPTRLASMLETGPEGSLDARIFSRILRKAKTVEDAQRMLAAAYKEASSSVVIPAATVRKIKWIMRKGEQGSFTPALVAQHVGNAVMDACKFY